MSWTALAIKQPFLPTLSINSRSLLEMAASASLCSAANAMAPCCVYRKMLQTLRVIGYTVSRSGQARPLQFCVLGAPIGSLERSMELKTDVRKSVRRCKLC